VTLALPDGAARSAAVEGVRDHQGHVLLKVKGIDTVEGAEAMRGARVSVPRDTEPPLEPDSYYVADLVGMEVLRTDGRRLGTVQDVLRYPAQVLLVVGDALIPAVRAIVVSVDTNARTITVDPPDGLLPEQA
jgi:16S rRNA processing protein RimM